MSLAQSLGLKTCTTRITPIWLLLKIKSIILTYFVTCLSNSLLQFFYQHEYNEHDFEVLKYLKTIQGTSCSKFQNATISYVANDLICSDKYRYNDDMETQRGCN